MARWLAAGLAALMLATGCQGSGDKGAEADAAPQAAATTEAAQPPTTAAVAPATTDVAAPDTTATAPGEAGTTDRATMEKVVRQWSTRLNEGDNRALARLFTVPTVVAQSGVVVTLASYDEIEDFFASLPCSGTLVSITVDEPDIALAVFRLGDRLTSRCDGPGELAAARFHFRQAKLVAWEQVPVPGEEPPATEPAGTEPLA